MHARTIGYLLGKKYIFTLILHHTQSSIPDKDMKGKTGQFLEESTEDYIQVKCWQGHNSKCKGKSGLSEL